MISGVLTRLIVFLAHVCPRRLDRHSLYPAYGGALVDRNGHLQKIAGFEANMFLVLVVTMR